MLVVEGCFNDDKTVLGGKNEFFSHFCTFFPFNACYAQSEGGALKNLKRDFNDTEKLD